MQRRAIQNLFGCTFFNASIKENGEWCTEQKSPRSYDLKQKICGTKKIYMFSCHDVTLAAFACAHNISIFKLPPFNSAIILENYKDPQMAKYVRVR